MKIIKNRYPNFFIVGASRAGTTSLWIYLKEHPEIFMPEIIREKEPCYFTNLNGRPSFREYMRIFENAENKKIVGEASSNYLCAPESPKLIKDYNPDAKIIICLRNPVDRAYSLYRWMISEGYEWISPFEKALTFENERIKCRKSFNYYDYLYFSTGLYAEQIERYMFTFSPEQLHITLFDDLTTVPLITIQKIYRFLNVNDSYVPTLSIYNKSRFPLFPKLQRYIRHYAPKTLNIAENLMKLNLFIGDLGDKRLNSNTRQKMLMLYRDDILKTASLIKKDLNMWFDKNEPKYFV